MSGKRSRTKGANWERTLVHRYRQALPWLAKDIYRGLQSQGGDRAADVEVPGLWNEAKCGKCPPIRKALDQAIANAPFGRIPVAVIKEDRRPPFVVLKLSHWLDIISELYDYRNRLDTLFVDITGEPLT